MLLAMSLLVELILFLMCHAAFGATHDLAEYFSKSNRESQHLCVKQTRLSVMNSNTAQSEQNLPHT
jgi:hypothetical protein